MIKLSDDDRQRCIASLKRYADENLDETIGELKAGLLLDYILVEIAPTVYNQAIVDARTYFEEKADDLDGACHAPEFGYWKR